ncbi:MAG: hypothetical protein H0X46_03690 [Bacteroidetes bacterium]|nr:hypothetical protein [Bacteroidota bacterium]
MKIDSYKLILNHITAGEHMLNMKTPEKYEEYKQMAFMFLNHKGKHLFEENILSQYREGMTLVKLFDQEQNRFVQGANHKKDGKNQKTWYDLSAMEEIEREDHFFDYFFACKLRQINLLEIDKCLAFHLEHSFKDDWQDYSRFLNITLRKHQKMLGTDIVETVMEWIKLSETDNISKELSGNEKSAKTKNKVKRSRDDSVTKLNQEQTALLIHFLQIGKIILKDEDLNKKEAGQAFSILTGYSADSLRQNLSEKELNLISNKKNLAVISNAIINLGLLIDKEIKDKK